LAKMAAGEEEGGEKAVALQRFDAAIAERDEKAPPTGLGQADEPTALGRSAHGNRGSKCMGVLPVKRGSTIDLRSWP